MSVGRDVPNYSTCAYKALMARFLITFTAFCLLSQAAVAQITTTVGTPPADPAPGAKVTLTVYFMNEGAAVARAEAPATIATRLTARDSTVESVLTRLGEESARDIAAGTFWAVKYELALPKDAGGTVAVELRSAGSPRTAIAVASASGAAGVATRDGDAGATTATQPSFRLGRESLPNEPALPPNDSGVAEAILPRFSAHEPIYFIAGPDKPNAKFQVSFKYQIFNPDGPWSQAFPPLSGIHLAYSQTSFWDLESDSAPFLDSSYRPELLWSAKDWRIENSVVSRLGLQLGINHESNGQDGGDSRSLNVAYIRPSITFGDPDGFFFTFAPKIYTYVFGMDATNDDIADYRGHADLRLIAGERDGLQLAVIGRVGDDWDKGSVQFDLSYPMRRFFNNNVDLYLHAQYFTGYGESLLDYDEYTNRWRVGVSIVR